MNLSDRIATLKAECRKDVFQFIHDREDMTLTEIAKHLNLTLAQILYICRLNNYHRVRGRKPPMVSQ
jgi:predicted transcriptional regulator